jgi:hypothetical protein
VRNVTLGLGKDVAGPVVLRACFVPRQPCRDSGPDKRRVIGDFHAHAYSEEGWVGGFDSEDNVVTGE